MLNRAFGRFSAVTAIITSGWYRLRIAGVELTHKLLTFHELRPTRKEPKLDGPAQTTRILRSLQLCIAKR